MRRPFNDEYPITQFFGEHFTWYIKYGLKGHSGLDYGMPTGTVLLAPDDCDVTGCGNDPNGYGLYYKLENEKYKFILGHLSRQDVAVGQHLNEGQEVGLSGNSGNSTGAHLHFEIRPLPQDDSNGYGGAVDPLPILAEEESMSNEEKELLEKIMNAQIGLEEKVGELSTKDDLKAVQDHLQNEIVAVRIKMTDYNQSTGDKIDSILYDTAEIKEVVSEQCSGSGTVPVSLLTKLRDFIDKLLKK